jgi:hypothetical protein
MSSNYANIDNIAMGKLLDIVFSRGVRDQLPANFAEFDLVKMLRVAGATEREIRHKIQTGRGPARVQAASPGVANANFPAAQAATILEVTAKLKQYEATTTIAAELFERLRGTSAKAADELAIEMEATMMDIKRRICADFYNDGSGIVVRLAAAGVETKSGANVQYVTCTAQLMGVVDTIAAPGSVTFLEPGDILYASAANGAGTAVAPTETSGSSFYGWEVVSVDVDAGTFVVKPVDSSGTLVADITDSALADNVMLHRIGDKAALAATDSVADWAVASNYITGLESLTAIDGRTVMGVPMTGVVAGSRHDLSSGLIDVSAFQKAISKAKRRVGSAGYKWDSALMSYASFDALVDSREADRRFVSLDDTVRGGKKFAYQHGNDSIEFVVSEFCPVNRIHIIPKGGKQGKVLGLHMRDAEHVKGPNGEPWHLNVNSSGFIKQFIAFHMLFAQLVCYQPAAIATITGFVNA